MNSLKIFGDRALRTSIIAMAVPVALQNLITYCTGMMDTVMLGQLGEIQLSAASVANQFHFIFLGITFGVCSGTNVLLSQYWGKKDTVSMRHILSIAYWITLIFSLIFFIAGFMFPAQIIGFFTPDKEVIAAGIQYMRIVCFSYIGVGISNMILMTLRSVGTVKISVIIYAISLVVNTSLNYIFIFGKLGIPAMGIRGAAVATLIARSLEAILAVLFMLFVEDKIHIKLRNLFTIDFSFIKDFSKNVVPVIFNELLWSLGNSMLMVVMGHMGRAFVTANSITTVATQLTQIVTIGLSNATSVIIGNSIGAKEYNKAKDLSKGLMTLSVFMGLCGALLILLLRPVIISFYNISDETRVIVMSVLAVASIVVFFQTMAITEFMGILRGGGDVHFVLFGDIAFMWILSIPLGAFVGLVLDFPPAIVYLVLKIDEVMKIIAGAYRIHSGKWIKELTR